MFKYSNLLIDKITGFDISGKLENVMERDFWPREKIEAEQAEKFARLSVIAAKSKYYKDLANKPLDHYPVMMRKQFKEHGDELLTHIRKPYSVQHTSGSTGFPVTLHISKEMILAKRVSHQKMLSWYGLSRESKEFKIGGLKQDLKTRIYYLLKNKRFVNSFVITDDSIKGIINRYNRFKPDVLYGYPSAIFNFLQFARAGNLNLHHPQIVITHAENLFPEYVETYQAAFPGASVINQYWSTEANIGETCPEGRIHFDEDTIIPEVVNVGDDGVGDLLITNLYSFDQPLIRYSIGDRVKLSTGKCPCGRESRTIEHIEGRQAEDLQLPDGRTIPATALYFSRFAQNLLSYQIAYFKKDARVEFRFVPLDSNKPINEEAIQDYLKSDFGLETQFLQVQDLEYTPSGKFKKVILMD